MTEELSAWIDGELGREYAGRLPSQLNRNADLRGIWDCYHLIGDALRGAPGPNLCARICARLDAEPSMDAPPRRSAAKKLGRVASSAAARIAAVVFVAFVGWMTMPGMVQDPVQIQDPKSNSIAAVRAPEVEVKPVAVPSAEDANPYFLAHQRYSPSNAMLGVATYVRAIAAGRSADSKSPSASCPPLQSSGTP